MTEGSTRPDLTRWNRAGLSRFRYVDGNAVTFLETLRRALLQAPVDPATDPSAWEAWLEKNDPSPGETPLQAQERLLAQYQDQRRDYAWEILRAFARSTHILTEYLDAYANEGFLGTATQWEYIRRLVDMLGYRPAPPASASTWLALYAKVGKHGLIYAGVQVKNEPQDGSASIIFETLTDLEVDERLNTLRIKDWNRSQSWFDCKHAQAGSKIQSFEFPLAKPEDNLSVGSIGVLLIDIDQADGSTTTAGIAVRLTGVNTNQITLQGLIRPTEVSFPVRLHQVRLLVKPKLAQAPLLAGAYVLELSPSHGLVTESAVAWKCDDGNWYVGKIVESGGDRVRLATNVTAAHIPQRGDIYRLTKARAQRFTPNSNVGEVNAVVLPLQREVRTVWSDRDLQALWFQTVKENGTPVYDYVVESEVYFLPKDSKAVASIRQAAPTALELDGSPGPLTSGQWVVWNSDASDASALKAMTVQSVARQERRYCLELAESVSTSTARGILIAGFEKTLYPRDYDRNETSVDEDLASILQSRLTLAVQLGDLPGTLAKGRRVLVKNDRFAHSAVITALEEAEWGLAQITIQPALPKQTKGDIFNRHDTVVCANVVSASHGESQPERVLGSGDATRPLQAFRFDVRNIAFVLDQTQPTGVAAAIKVLVDGIAWQQVGDLRNAEPEDAAYTIHIEEDGALLIQFGDGRHGRLLPSGRNNVRVLYRTGKGLAGNLAVSSIRKLVAPHPLLDKVEQPLAASGGNEMEGTESIRQCAPASVLTLGRAVSIEDFAHLAESHSSVWQVSANRIPPGPGRREKVEVIVVPSGGELQAELANTLQGFLLQNAPPGIDVKVLPFEKIPLQLDIAVQAKLAEVDAESLRKSIEDAVKSAFSLQQRRLGQPFYQSELYLVVENVSGVQNSVCEILSTTVDMADSVNRPSYAKVRGGGSISVVFASPAQLIYLDPDHSVMTVTVTSFSL